MAAARYTTMFAVALVLGLTLHCSDAWCVANTGTKNPVRPPLPATEQGLSLLSGYLAQHLLTLQPCFV